MEDYRDTAIPFGDQLRRITKEAIEDQAAKTKEYSKRIIEALKPILEKAAKEKHHSTTLKTILLLEKCKIIEENYPMDNDQANTIHNALDLVRDWCEENRMTYCYKTTRSLNQDFGEIVISWK